MGIPRARGARSYLGEHGPRRAVWSRRVQVLGAWISVLAVQWIMADGAQAFFAGTPVKCEPFEYCSVDFEEGKCVPTAEGKRSGKVCRTVREQDQKAGRRKSNRKDK